MERPGSEPDARPGAGSRPAVRIERAHGIYHVEGGVGIRAPLRLVWEVLTDYDHLASFIPAMVRSQLLGTDDDGSRLLEQVAEGSFLFLSRRVRVLLRVEEDARKAIRFRLKEGDFKVYDGGWRLEERGNVTFVKYSLHAQPHFFVPEFIFGGQLQETTRKALDSVAVESERRHAQSGRKSAASR